MPMIPHITAQYTRANRSLIRPGSATNSACSGMHGSVHTTISNSRRSSLSLRSSTGVSDMKADHEPSSPPRAAARSIGARGLRRRRGEGDCMIRPPIAKPARPGNDASHEAACQTRPSGP